MQIVFFALRNFNRARTRTWITVGAMAFACAIMIFYASLLEGWLAGMEKNAVGMDLGELQVHATGFRADPDLYKTIVEEESVLALLGSEGFVATPRLYASGLAAAGNASSGIELRGVDLVREPQVTALNVHVWQGQWLEEQDQAGVVLGRKLARILGLTVGDEVVVVAQAADGSTANELFRVRGILKSVAEGVDRSGFFMTSATFRRMMIVPNGAHAIVVKRQVPTENLTQATARLARLLPSYEVRNWRQLQPVLARLFEMSDVSLVIMLLITYAAVGILTLNALLMSVFERIPEFGVMKALGFSPWGLFAMIVAESMLQVTVAAILALAAGLPLAMYFSHHPIDFSGFVQSSSTIAGVALDAKWYCVVTVHSVLLPVLFLYLVAGLAILYPALKAAMLKPLAAIYHR
ncbi:MAG: FtsX-like permease family protein [Deltaproteobacteria bacterium]|nr:FtsX-like permease family protein [Deltaproteobacteria bacterium]